MSHNHRRLHRQVDHAGNNLQGRGADVATIVSVVYVTMPQTFSGPAVYITPTLAVSKPVETTADSTPLATKAVSSAAHASSSNKDSSSLFSASSAAESSSAASTTFISSTQANAFLVASSTMSATAAAITSATSTATASPASSGMSGGAKAGLTFGILIAIAAVLALVLLLYRKKKQNLQRQPLDDEKGSIRDGPAPVAASIRTARTMSTAPRLSLRPVTQFSPNLASNRKSAGNNLEMASAPAANANIDSRGLLTPSPQPTSAWERQGASNAANDPANPFGNHAETFEPSAPTTPEPGSSPRASSPVSEMSVGNNDSLAPASAEGAVAAATLATPIVRKDVPKPLSVKSETLVPAAMPSPAWTDDIPAFPSPASTGPPPAAAAGGVAAAPVPNNVHRVQLDFKPSMEDELGLRAGQLVRMLHEYDDGWALCIRLDRSQQGVVPRTCLSKHPVKPRTGPPRQGPPGTPKMRSPPMGPGFPQPRPLSPAPGRNSPGPYGGQPRPMSPAGGRNSPGPYVGPPHSASPAGGRNSPGPYGQPRPMSPSNGGRARSNSNSPYPGPRSMSPGPYIGGPQQPIPPPGGRRRSNSASQVMARRNSPPGPSPMNPNSNTSVTFPVARKPLPGMAL
ncbi:hypothetical protein K432DRAFT_414967 [Lepidopterella palustris CBS 459.81]|uniref:SH3 domain-containing protein n=1 Tax=Lepidopterella palustris CBS 459.81 TaxID=1314670 RepID=A0A8E2JHT8_9PEZI|nr:hypothetical protein K432DRAFT_414967 [Lepidopterella palustris CBS 459.81]